MAGVPPDYFSSTGQLWGNPVYDWEALRAEGFRWWLERLSHNMELYDYLRIDHFRGLVASWEVPAGEKTGVRGEWKKVPAEEFFAAVLDRLPEARLVAQDLGTITPDVVDLRRRFGFPGMKVLLFAFGDDPVDNPHLPHNYERNSVVYTGTHDNNTVRGWFEKDATARERKGLSSLLGKEIGASEAAWEFVRLAMNSPAATAILPVQDILGLGEEARMNRPSVAEGNWKWRLKPGALDPALEELLRQTTKSSGKGGQ